jgi:hypothetical protein
MKREKSCASSIACIAAIIAMLGVLFMPQWVLAEDDASADNAALYRMAADTWRFYAADIDPNTNLPMDNLTWASGGSLSGKGQYTSASNIGVYLWAVVSARDLNLISRSRADSLVSATLNEVAILDRFQGMLYQWYDTTNGHKIRNPGDIDCTTEPTPVTDNCYFLSAVDNGWYASDPSPNQPTGQMYGGYLRQPGSGWLSQWCFVQRSAHRHLYRHGPSPDARRRVVAIMACITSEAAQPIPISRG